MNTPDDDSENGTLNHKAMAVNGLMDIERSLRCCEYVAPKALSTAISGRLEQVRSLVRRWQNEAETPELSTETARFIFDSLNFNEAIKKAHAAEVSKWLASLEWFHRRWSHVVPKTLVMDLESRLERGEELMHCWNKQPETEALRLTTARYIFDCLEFIGIANEKIIQYRGLEAVTLSLSANRIQECYRRFSLFCTYYNPYILKPPLKMRLTGMCTDLFRMCTQLTSGADGPAIKQQKYVFMFELTLFLLPDLVQHLLVSCDADKLRNDVDDLLDYLQANLL